MNASEIYKELCSAHDHATPECCCERCKNGHECFLLVSDITKIIADAKASVVVWVNPPTCPTGCGQILNPATGPWKDRGDWMCNGNHDGKRIWFDYELTMILTARLDAKAEAKGVCEWKVAFAITTNCGNLYNIHHINPKMIGYKFCPGCGKEIKVV